MQGRNKWSLVGGLGVASIYAILCGYMFLRQQQLLYQPEKNRDKTNDDVVFLPQLDLYGWIDNPGQNNAVIYYGGSSEPVQLRRRHFSSFTKETKYFIPYRGFWPNQNRVPTEKQIKEDAEKIFDYVKKRHEKVFLVGRSLGTSMALHVAARRKPDKLVLITPFYSILEIAQKKYRFFPIQKILKDWHEAHKDAGNIDVDSMIFLAENDKVTPLDSWKRLREHLNKSYKEFLVAGSNHTDIVQSSELWRKMRRFLRSK